MYLFKTIDIKKLIWLFNLVVIGYSLNAQPGWSLNVADYEYNGDITGIVILDGDEVSEGALGAFVGNECRGFVDAPRYFPPTEEMVFQFLVYSNETSGEYLSFRYYNPSDGEIYIVKDSIEFVSDMIVGKAKDPYIFIAEINRAPEIISIIDDQIINEHFGSLAFDLDTVFYDPDDNNSDDDDDSDDNGSSNNLTYNAVSADEEVCTVSIAGSVLSITEQAPGSTSIMVEATDGIDTVSFSFNITIIDVNDAPLVLSEIQDQVFNQGFIADTIILTDFFSDPENDELAYTVSVDNENILSADITDDSLFIFEISNGSTDLTITASDGEYQVSDEFNVTIIGGPFVANEIDDLFVDEGFGAYSINLDNVFTSPEGNELFYSAEIADEDIATVTVEGNLLTITEVSGGVTTIQVAATDGNLSIETSFLLSVNRSPEIENILNDISENEKFDSVVIKISNYFSDPDQDDLIFSVENSDINVISAYITGDTLVMKEAGPGVAQLTVIASDGSLSVSQEFSFTVVNLNDAPVLINPFPDSEIVENIDSLVFSFNDFFSDPDNEQLLYSIEIEDESVLSYVMNDSEVKFKPLAVGQSEVYITATDAEGLFVSDTLIVEVVKENLLLLKLRNSRKIKDTDTILVCNRAGSVTLNVLTINDWDFVSPNNLWLLLTVENDSTMTISFSENIAGEDRMAPVKVTDSQGHEIDFYILQTENCETSTNDYKNTKALNVYPNPTNDFIFIDLNDPGVRLKIKLFNLDGRMIHQEVLPNVTGSPVTIDMQPYKEGFYFLNILEGEVRHTMKILKN